MVGVAGSGSCGAGGRATRRRRPNLGCVMCGIVAVLRRWSGRMPPDGAHLLDELEQAVSVVGVVGGADQAIADQAIADQAIPGPDVLACVAAQVEGVDALLKGAPGVRALLADRALAVGVEHHAEQLQRATDRVEAALDANGGALPAELATVEREDGDA